MQQIDHQIFTFENKKLGQIQLNKKQQDIIMGYLGLAKLPKKFISNFLKYDHVGPYKKKQFIKSVKNKGIVLRILSQQLLDQNMIKMYPDLTILKCSIKDFHKFLVPFLQNMQSWNIANLELSFGETNQNSQSQQIKILKYNLLFLIFNRIQNQIIPKIDFKNLQALALRNLQISNIQFLTFINAPLLRKVFLKVNNIVSTKSLTKFKRTNFSSPPTQKFNFIELIQNPINQYPLNRMSLLNKQAPGIMLFIHKYNNHFFYRTDLRFIVKSQINVIKDFSIKPNISTQTYTPVDQKLIDKQHIKINNKFNHLLNNNLWILF